MSNIQTEIVEIKRRELQLNEEAEARRVKHEQAIKRGRQCHVFAVAILFLLALFNLV